MNIFVDQIVAGYTESGRSSAEESANTVASEWGGKQYLQLKQDAMDRLLSYYTTLN